MQKKVLASCYLELVLFFTIKRASHLSQKKNGRKKRACTVAEAAAIATSRNPADRKNKTNVWI